MSSGQHIKNHARLVPMFHGVTGGLVLITTIGCFINLYKAASIGTGVYSASLLCAFALISIFFFFFMRIFALRAQDRAIRVEENFRHYLLTGVPLDDRLRIGQIVALRFASDVEFPAIAKMAVEKNMTQKQIKEEIKNWRGDYYRV